MDIAKMFAEIVGGIIALYIAFILVSSFVEITPEFAGVGWGIFIIMAIGIILVIVIVIAGILKSIL